MILSTVGINHKTADIRLREQVAFVNAELPNALADAYQHHKLNELVVLSTCNRTELISSKHNSDALLEWFAQNRNTPIELLRDHCYILEEKNAIKHLVEVACGMDAMMFGESEIFGQVKTAYRIAQDCGTVSPALQHVFEQIFRITKLIRTQTDINKNPTSIHSCTVRLMEQSVDALDQANVVLIGTSEMIELITAHLVGRGVHNITILNRTHSNARTLAERFDISAAPLKELKHYLYQADIVVSCTGSAQLVIEHPLIKNTMTSRAQRPLLLVDLAVPRDIDHTASNVPQVRYHDIDNLQEITNASHAARQSAARVADKLIDEQLRHYQGSAHLAESAERISHYREQANALCDKELRKSLKRLQRDDDPAQVLKDFARALTSKLTHAPTTVLRRTLKDTT